MRLAWNVVETNDINKSDKNIDAFEKPDIVELDEGDNPPNKVEGTSDDKDSNPKTMTQVEFKLHMAYHNTPSKMNKSFLYMDY